MSDIPPMPPILGIPPCPPRQSWVRWCLLPRARQHRQSCPCRTYRPCHPYWAYRPVLLVNLGSAGVSSRGRRSTAKVAHVGHSAHATPIGHTALSSLLAIGLGDDGSPQILNLLLFGLELLPFRVGVGIDPVDRLLHRLLHFLAILLSDQVLELFVVHGVPHLIGHALQLILGLYGLPLH